MKHIALSLVIAICILTIISPKVLAARIDQNPIGLVVNEKVILTDTPPILENNRVLVPIRAVTEAMDVRIAWDNDKKLVSVFTKKFNQTVRDKSITANVRIEVNGKLINTDVPPKNINGRVMIPIRALAEAVGANVAWESNKRKVIVTTTDQPEVSLSITFDEASTYHNQLKTPDPITLEILESSDETIRSSFSAIEQWISLVYGGKDGLWYFIDNSVHENIVKEWEKHFTEAKAKKLIDQYYRFKGGYYQFLEQDIRWRLHHEISNLVADVQFHENNARATVTFEGFIKEDVADFAVHETFILVRNHDSGNYFIEDMIFKSD